MKIILVGGTGTIGQAIAKELAPRHTLVIAAHEHGDVNFDITDPTSIEKMYQQVGKFDAVISAVGKVHFGELATMTPADFMIGLNDKLMGQVNLVVIGQHHINDRGSFTLTSGILNEDPIRAGSSAAMVNGALAGFCKSAAIELPRGIRINVVSPTIITEALPAYGDYFHGFESVSAARAAMAYSKSVEGLQTGQVYRVGY